jgi:hypothetical protein
MRLVRMISLLSILSSQIIAGKASTTVDVWWIPPDVETYTPVTADNIEERAFKVVHVQDDHQAEEVIALIQRSGRVADPARIRVKISFDDKSYDFDPDGIGVSSKGERVQIDLRKLKAALCE